MIMVKLGSPPSLAHWEVRPFQIRRTFRQNPQEFLALTLFKGLSSFWTKGERLFPTGRTATTIYGSLQEHPLHLVLSGAGGIRTRTEYYSSGF